MAIPDRTVENAIEKVEEISERIDRTYSMVFSSVDNFEKYFFATPDHTTEDAQVRLGVFIKKLTDDPEERFWLMRRVYRGSNLPKTSIQNLESCGGYGQALALNGYTKFQIDAWKKEQPDEMQQFLEIVEAMVKQKLQLPQPLEDKKPKTIYVTPRVDITPENVQEVLQAVLPPDSEVDFRRYSDQKDHHWDIKAPQVGFDIHVWNHEEFGDYIGITFPSELSGYVVNPQDEGIQAEFAKYMEEHVTPSLLENAIKALNPNLITDAIGKQTGIFERMFLTPNVFHDRSEGKYIGSTDKNKKQYFAYGKTLDIGSKYAQALGLLPKEMGYQEFTFLGGWFLTKEQVWHALFNSPCPKEIKPFERNGHDTSIEVRNGQISDTHRRVVEGINDQSDDREGFAKKAQEVIEGYRLFMEDDI